jgi:transposase
MATSPSPIAPAAPQTSPVFVGIDIAKVALDVARSDTRQVLHLPNDPAGFKTLIATLARARPLRIVIEATGGLEQPLLDALLDAGLPVARVNPGNVRHFAKAHGILAKTDAIDAAVLVEFARLVEPRLAEKRSKQQTELDALVTCRRQLKESKTQQTNRLGVTLSKPARKALSMVIHALEKQIKTLDKQIARILDSDDDFKQTNALLRSVPGVGPGLAASLIAELSELGDTGRRALSALVGVAPFNKDSGACQGRRAIRGGRASLRCVLYMATIAAMRFNPIIKAFADRLALKAKPGKVIIVACMRKLLSLLNAMIRDNLPWEKLHVVLIAKTV